MLAFVRKSMAIRPSTVGEDAARLPVQCGQTLLAEHSARLHSVRNLVGVPQQHWQYLYHTLFVAFAETVQRLPASEAHHHCEPGGLLRHALEVTEVALKIRRGYVLPPDTEPETVVEEQEVWTYAVATAALLHDVGKALVDQRIELQSRDGSRIGVWSPWVGPMTETGSTHYRVEFRRGHPHRLHEAVTPLLAPRIVPNDGLRWLGDHHDTLAAWLSAIGGSTFGNTVIADIVKAADQRSVARDLSGERRQLPTANAKPLAERLLTALRQLIDSGALPINRQGAAAFIDDRAVWLVSKRGLDAIRDALEGQGGIPSRNDRLMDELQQRGFALPSAEQRAVWRCEVRVGDAAESWCQILTLLCIPIDYLWPDPDARPAAADVQVCEVDAEAPPEDTAPAAAQTSADQSADADCDVATTSDDHATEGDDAGEAFLPWLVAGLKGGSLALNTAKARAHVVDEGLLLVSPAIFREFADEDWRDAQKQFLKRKLTAKTARGENIVHYAVDSDAGQKTVKGVLIRNPEAKLGLELPAANALLSRKSDAE